MTPVLLLCKGTEDLAAAAKLLQSCLTLYDPIDGSPPGSPVPGILQVRTLEWVAITFSNAWKWKVKVKSLSRARLLVTPWTAAYQVPPSMGFSRQEYWSGLSLPSPTEDHTQLQNWRKGIYSPCLYMVSHTHKPEKVFKLSWNSNFHKINWQILIVFGSHIWDQKKVFFQTLQCSMAKLF